MCFASDLPSSFSCICRSASSSYLRWYGPGPDALAIITFITSLHIAVQPAGGHCGTWPDQSCGLGPFLPVLVGTAGSEKSMAGWNSSGCSHHFKNLSHSLFAVVVDPAKIQDSRIYQFVCGSHGGIERSRFAG